MDSNVVTDHIETIFSGNFQHDTTDNTGISIWHEPSYAEVYGDQNNQNCNFLSIDFGGYDEPNEYGDDIEVIAVDPEQEYTDDEMMQYDDTDNTDDPNAVDVNYTNMDITEFRAALQQSNHRRVCRKSMSLPHSPLHYSLDLSGISLDDLDILAPQIAPALLATTTNSQLPDVTPVKNFDLASYITKDDNFDVISPNPRALAASSSSGHKKMGRTCAISAKKMHYSAEPDVEFDEDENNNSGDNEDDNVHGKDDNPKIDPTWCPTQGKSSSTTKKINKKSSVKDEKKKVKVEKQKDSLKKSTQKPTVHHEKKVSHKSVQILPKDKTHKVTTNKSPLVMGKTVKLDHDYCTGKKGLSKTPRKAIEIPIITDSSTDLRSSKCSSNSSKKTVVKKIEKPHSQVIPTLKPLSQQMSLLKVNSQEQIGQSVKRKLNLDEYFERKANVEPQPQAKTVIDPILEAKRKVLRRQELKKQAKLQESEPKIDNVPLLPILPLSEIMTNAEPIKILLNPDYEEIVIVSMGCNTDISIPASEDPENLYSYIEDSIKKVSKSEKVLTNNSLIASIQDTVMRKSTNNFDAGCVVAAKNKTAKSDDKDHGEDKIIMHLRKDRKRPECVSIAVQTVEIAQLAPPPSKLLGILGGTQISEKPPHQERQGRSKTRSRGNYRRQRRQSSSSSSGSSGSSTTNSSRSTSAASVYSQSSYDSRSRMRSVGSYKRRKYNSSRSSSRQSASYSSSRSRSRDSNYSHQVRRRKQYSSENPEKRNVVYVGRLEEDLSREELKKKFRDYGPVKRATIHYKNNGLRYGFVTFEKPEQAYNAIERCSSDPNISMYDVSFGGRRAFCKAQYSDLDGIHSYYGESYYGVEYPVESYLPFSPTPKSSEPESFEDLLKQVKAKIQKREA